MQYSKFLVDLIAALLNKDQSQRPRIREILGWLDNAMNKNDSPRQKESANRGHNNIDSNRRDSSESSTEDEQGNTRAKGRRSKRKNEDDRRKNSKGRSTSKVGSSGKTNSRAGSTMGERPPMMNLDGDKRKNRYKERPKTAHSRKSNSRISRAGSMMGDKPPPSQDNISRPSSGYSTSSQKYSKLKERSRQYREPIAQEGIKSAKRDRNGLEQKKRPRCHHLTYWHSTDARSRCFSVCLIKYLVSLCLYELSPSREGHTDPCRSVEKFLVLNFH